MSSTVTPAVRMESRRIALDRPRHVTGLASGMWIAGRASAVGSAAIGLLVLVGYVFRWPTAVQLHPSLPPMYPNAALGFAIGGISALLATSHVRSRRLTGLAGFAVIGVGSVVTLVLHFMGAGPTALEGLWPEHFMSATTPVGGRPVIESTVAFVCIAAAGILVAGRWHPVLSQALAFGAMCVGLAGVLGYLLGVDRRDLGTWVVGMALHTAVGLGALSAALTLSRPTLGLFAGLVRGGPGAQLSRRLVVVMVAAPVILASLSTALIHRLGEPALAESFMAVLQVIVLGALVMLPLRAAERVEQSAADSLSVARNLLEEAGEHDEIVGALVEALSRRPDALEGWDLGVRQIAAFGMLPGDTCQVLHRRSDGAILLALVDMAGHGTGAALQALRLRNEIDALWRTGATVEQISDEVDRSVADMGTISTGLFVALDPVEQVCRYVNGGHPPLLCVRRGQIDSWPRTRPLFGVDTGQHASVVRVLEPSATLVAYSDGVSEARSPGRQFLDEERLRSAIRRSMVEGAQAVADACMDAAVSHTSGRLRDDAVVVVLQRT